MKESAANTESKTTEVKSGYDDSTKSDIETPKDDNSSKDSLDDYGYDKTPKDDDSKKEIPTPDNSEDKNDKTPEPKDNDEEGDKSTGYDDDDKSDDDKEDKSDEKKEDKEGEESSEEDLKKEIDTALENLPEGYDKEKMSKFATDNKMSVDQMKAYVDFVKVEYEENIKINAESQKTKRKAWKNELMDDSEFGGENFKQSVHNVDKILNNYMPNMKKALTDGGFMMPPYIMKDLLKISKVLNPKTNLVTGDPKVPEKKESGLDEYGYKI